MVVNGVAQFVTARRVGVDECCEHRATTTNLETVSFGGVLGRENHDDRTGLVVEELRRSTPHDAGLEETLFKHQRRRLAKAHEPGLPTDFRLTKRGLRHFINPDTDAGAIARIRGLGVGVEVCSVEPEAQPIGRRRGRAPLAAVLGHDVGGECSDFAPVQGTIVNQHLSKCALVARVPGLAGARGVVTDTDVLRLRDVGIPFAFVAATFLIQLPGRHAIGEERPLSVVRRRHREV